MTARMNPEIKARWIAWLRDPSHEQGQSYLKKGGKYCCLGGLCELAIEDGVIHRSLETTRILQEDTVSFYGESAVLGGVVMDWAGLESNRAYIAELRERIPGSAPPDTLIDFTTNTNLASLNDSGLTFNQIADIIDYFL
jgi:hypothetical protein